MSEASKTPVMNQEATAIVNQIEEMVQDIPGWSPIDQLYTLFNLVYFNSHLPGDIVEVGSWCGRSATVLGAAAKLIGATQLVCIDLFPEKDDWRQNEDGSYSFQVKLEDGLFSAYQGQTVWNEPYHRDIVPIYENNHRLLDVFLNNISRRGLQNLIIVHRGTSSTYAQSARSDFKCKLIFLDGDHGYDEVCRDIASLSPYLVDGGWICFDDAFSHYDGVNRAIRDMIIRNPEYDLCQQMTRKFFVARKRFKPATST